MRTLIELLNLKMQLRQKKIASKMKNGLRRKREGVEVEAKKGRVIGGRRSHVIDPNIQIVEMIEDMIGEMIESVVKQTKSLNDQTTDKIIGKTTDRILGKATDKTIGKTTGKTADKRVDKTTVGSKLSRLLKGKLQISEKK